MTRRFWVLQAGRATGQVLSDAARVSSSQMTAPRCRVAITGGPGGGKSTAVDLFRRELGESVVVVPESATMLFAGGFPRTDLPEARMHAQRAIFHVQRNLEDLYRSMYPGRALICDRGTVDG
ncbi:MAG: AAA family ATPase, partial [Myxococcales bacterium]|nr:AAA family ATPase [Myxococcales bacterium]